MTSPLKDDWIDVPEGESPVSGVSQMTAAMFNPYATRINENTEALAGTVSLTEDQVVSGDKTFTGGVRVEQQWTTLDLVNVLAEQYSGAGFKVYNGAATVTGPAGVQLVSGISDSGATETYLEIATVDRTGAYIGILCQFNLDTGQLDLKGVLDLESHKIINLSNGTAPGDAVNLGQLTSALLTKLDASTKGQVNGVAPLDATGKLPAQYAPDIAVVDFLGVAANQAAMLAFVGQKGDWCTRSDSGTDWQIIGTNSAQLASWRQMTYPASPVASVAGLAGIITATALRNALSLVVGTDVQAQSAILSGLAAASIANGGTRLLVTGDAGATWGTLSTTAIGRSLLLAADATAGRTALELGSAALLPASAFAPALTPTAVKTSGYTAAAGELVPCNGTSGGFTITLPTTPADKSVVAITRTDAAATGIQVGLGGSAKFYSSGGAAAIVGLWAQGDVIVLQYQAAGDFWHVVSRTKPAATIQIPVWFEVQSTYGVRAAGYGVNTMGFMVPEAFTLTQIVYRGETADTVGPSVFEVQKNGVQIPGSSKSITAANQWGYDADITVTGLSVALSAGDVIRPYISSVGAAPGNGFSAVLVGYKTMAMP